MRMDYQFKLHRLVNPTPTRVTLHSDKVILHVQEECIHAYATEGHAVVRVELTRDCTDEGTEGVYAVPSKVWQGVSTGKGQSTGFWIGADETPTLSVGGASWEVKDIGILPDWCSILDRIPQDAEVDSIGVTPWIIFRVFEAMGFKARGSYANADQARISFSGPTTMLTIRPMDSLNRSIGVVMPVVLPKG